MRERTPPADPHVRSCCFWRRHRGSASGSDPPRSEIPEEEARRGPGVMASKEIQVVKNLNVESAEQENDGREQASMKNEEESSNLGGGEAQKPEGNVKRGRVRRFVPNFRWAMSNKHVDRNELGGKDVERCVGQMVEVKKKAKERQVRNYMRFQTPEPDNHYDFCLIP
ncbi:protein BEX4 [Perognathus longimembris pacificus]|uniref:protein BEX4 n=1 Tax=Perognathus longimembris pacificus TaxID=214514 RepID=UPI00201A07CC|nr:protein BEX4 [Perognathus longimembris pacificus]